MLKKPILIIALGAVSAAALAQGTQLYSSQPGAKAQGLVLRHWGSGTIAETDELASKGAKQSLRVSSRNYFQGGFVVFEQPKDLAKQFDDKNNLLKLTYRLADSNLQLGGASAGDPAGGTGKKPGGGANMGGGTNLEGQEQRSGNKGMGGMPGTGGQGSPTTGGAPTRDPLTQGQGIGTVVGGENLLKRVRVIITTTDGKKSEAYVDIRQSGGINGWREAAIPLQAITGFDKTNKVVKEIAFAGDATTTFYISDIKVIDDTTEISGDVNATDLNLALGDEVTLIANGFGGATPLKYTWDFDAADGLQVDAEGQVVKRKFRKAGKSTITVTIADLYGIKKPVVHTIEVTVNP